MSRAKQLAELLNSNGHDQWAALDQLGLTEDDVMSEDAGLPIGDRDNEEIDLLDGTFVRREGARVIREGYAVIDRVGGTWRAYGEIRSDD
jgi:hypothetical protein